METDIELSDSTRALLDTNNLSPLWEVERDELGVEREDLQPEVWGWETLKDAIDSIEDDVAISELPPGFQRRVVVPVNPTYPGSISHTIYVGVQTVSPGETAPSHRHGANALRFAIDGDEDVRSVVGGEEFPMRDNDLITTPQWEWHDHVNESDETAAWLDVLDLPLMFNSLNAGNLFEDHDDERQPVDKPMGYHETQYGKLRAESASDTPDIPGPFDGFRTPTPPFRFGYRDCREALEYAAEANEGAHSPHDGVRLHYVNPATGEAPLFPTFGVTLQLLADATEPHSHNATEVYFAVEGSGQTHVDGETLAWSERDIFVVPPNAPHSHDADGEAVLLALSDRPLFEALNFYHEQAE